VSPHWTTHGVRVGGAARPPTIHDFGGFDPALYRIAYPAPGDPALAARVAERLAKAGMDASVDGHRGLDHGVWVPLRHLWPRAEVPIVPVSMPARLDADGAWALGEALAPLADEGVLVIGSGSLTHNLREFFGPAGRIDDYVTGFVDWVSDAVERGDDACLRRTLDDAPHARRAHPTPEHFWPLLVAAAAGPRPGRRIDGGVVHGMLSMDAFAFGEPVA
jgi:4,5-DOPA dioxygenase extradiol